MISYPKANQQVRIRYGKRKLCNDTLQDRIATVAIVGSGKPRNHGVLVDGVLVVIPAGNLMPLEPSIATKQLQFCFTKP